MKTLIASVLATLSLNAFSVALPLHEQTVWSFAKVDASYGINEEMGRAWVELAVHTSTDVDSSPDYVRVKVPGMSIVGGSVVLDVDGQQVECAKIRPVGIFRYRMAKATGNCQVKSRTERRIEDDGFNTRKVTKLVVTLETK